ncbi:MAG: VIT family protein, partial [Sphingomonadales bacterium]
LSTARPLQAAFASAVTFSAGAAMPLLSVPLAPERSLTPVVVLVSLISLAILGSLGAKAGGAPVARSVLRVTFWGALAMILTAGIGLLFGTSI